jgi:multiple sugar transport system substrate-binding protein
MKASRRRSVAVLACVFALALAGCGRSTGGGKETGTAVGEGKAKGEITVWAMGTEGEKLPTLANDFMKENPDAKVKVTAVPWDGAHDKIATAIAGRQTPDASLIGTTWMGEFAKTGGLDPTPANLVKKEDFFGGAWNTTVVNNVSYGVPWVRRDPAVLCEQGRRRQGRRHVSTEDLGGPQGGDQGVQGEGRGDVGVSLQPGGTGSWQSVLPFVWQNGVDVYSGGKFTLDTPQATEAFAYYKSFFDEGLAPKDLPQGALEPDFVKSQIGAFISGPWHIGLLKAQGGADKYMLWHMPGKQAATSFIGGSDLCRAPGRLTLNEAADTCSAVPRSRRYASRSLRKSRDRLEDEWFCEACAGVARAVQTAAAPIANRIAMSNRTSRTGVVFSSRWSPCREGR